MTARDAEGLSHFGAFRSCMACLRRMWCALTAAGWRCAECLPPDALDRLLSVVSGDG